MPGIEISGLPPIIGGSSLTDVLPTDQSGPITGKVTNQQLLTLFQQNGQILSSTSDTNVTISLGGSPSTALLNPASLTMGWAGQLSPARGGTGVNNGSNTLTLAGNLSTAGSFPATFNFSASTNVTFPTSGTLATTAGTVTALSGTTNQITASASTGAVTLAIASNPILPGTAGVTLPSGNTAARGGSAGTMRFNSQTSVFEATTDGATWATIETSSTSVTSVSGTANRITSTGGTTPVIDISASYVGQPSITTLGTIGTGTWNGSVISGTFGGTGVNNGASTITIGGSHTLSGAFASTFTFTGITNVTFPTSGTLATTSQLPTLPLSLANGGTNASLTASNGGIVYSNASAFAVVAGTATAGQMLQSGASTIPAWSTSTYPATNAANTLLYASSANVMSALATANSAVLVTSAGGAPSLSTTLPNINIGTPSAGVLTNTTGGGGLRSFQVFTTGTAATYTKPAGVTSIYVEVIGGGGGGGGATGAASSASAGAGGGAGGYAALFVASAASTYTYTVGGGGNGGTAGNNVGSTGSTTTFSASSLQATGGVGGSGMTSVLTTTTSAVSGGSGGVGSNGTFNCNGAPGIGGLVIGNGIALSGGGGSSLYGGGGVGRVTAAAGNSGTNYGSGGAGAASGTTSFAGGNGSGGLIIVWEFA